MLPKHTSGAQYLQLLFSIGKSILEKTHAIFHLKKSL